MIIKLFNYIKNYINTVIEEYDHIEAVREELSQIEADNEKLSNEVWKSAEACPNGYAAGKQWLIDTEVKRTLIKKNEDRYLELTDNLPDYFDVDDIDFAAGVGRYIGAYQRAVTQAMQLVSIKARGQ